jgi:hypothetical protein
VAPDDWRYQSFFLEKRGKMVALIAPNLALLALPFLGFVCNEH